MDDVQVIYHNNFGIAFRWKESVQRKNMGRIQLVFRDMGFYLLEDEVKDFSRNISAAKPKKACSKCKNPGECRSILLKSPLQKMDFVVSEKELGEIADLIEGTLFHLELDSYLKDISKN